MKKEFKKKLFFGFLFSPLLKSVILFLILHIPVLNLSLSMLDEGFVFYSAQRIANGEIPYKDFFLTTNPGSYYLIAFFIKIFGNYLIINRILHVLFGLLLLIIVNKIFTLQKYWLLFYLVVLSWLLAGPGSFSSYNNSIVLSLVALMFAKISIQNKKLSYVIYSGLFVSLSFIFKQSIGGLMIPAFFFIYLFFVDKKNRSKFTLIYCTTVLILVSIFYLYYLMNGALSSIFYYTFEFAKSVKSHESDFLVHRILFIPVFLVAIRIFKYLTNRKKIIFSSILIISGIFYLIFSPSRIGRLIDYIIDPVFYIYSIVFILPLIIISFPELINDKKRRLYSIYSIILLALFLSMAASGYSLGILFAVAPVLLPIIIRMIEVIGSRYNIYKPLTLFALILFVFTITNIAYNPFSSFTPLSSVYPKTDYIHASQIRETKFLKFPKTMRDDLDSVVNYVKRKVDKNEPIFCFPYCPMMYVLTERKSSSFYSLFYFETFLTEDQNKLISEIESQKPPLIAVQKTGDFEPRVDLESVRLSKVYDYIYKNYKKTNFKSDNFEIYEIKIN